MEQLVKSRTQELEEKNRQLLASEKKYRALVEASQDMIWSVDASGRYTFVNQAVKQIYGYDPEEMLGHRFADFEPPEQIIKDLELFQRLLDGESVFQYESTQLAKDGRPIDLLFNAIALRADQGNVIGTMGTASDITKRKQMEEALRESESMLRQITNIMPGVIYQFKLTAQGEKKYRFVSEGAYKLLGYTAERKEENLNGKKLVHFCLLTFEVKDTGPGIDPEEMHLLFVPFEQTATGRNSQQGTGLGLPLTRQFVQVMGGDITVSSTVGQGTIFKFDVPLCLAQSHEVQTPQETRRVIGLAPDQPNYRILVVEDVKSSRLLLVKLLTSTGFEVRETTNGLEAVALWESWKPQLILMDMQMPVMDGYEATKRIKAQVRSMKEENSSQSESQLQNPPQVSPNPLHTSSFTLHTSPVIIALTANAFEEDRAVILSAGCDDLVIKPFQEDAIFEKIARYLGVRYIYEEPVAISSEVRPQNEESPSDQFS